MRRLLLIAALLVTQAGSQTNANYVARKSTALSGAVETVTVQNPSTGGKVVIFDTAILYASVATDFTLKFGGTAATTTALTPTPLYHSTASTALAFHTSNVGAGTTVEVYTVPAGSTMVIDLSKFYLDASSASQNLSIASSSVTGTVRINIAFQEK